MSEFERYMELLEQLQTEVNQMPCPLETEAGTQYGKFRCLHLKDAENKPVAYWCYAETFLFEKIP